MNRPQNPYELKMDCTTRDGVRFENPRTGLVINSTFSHIAACLDACEGINPEAVPMMLEALKATKDAYASHQLYDKCPLPLIKAAIDKAEEKQ